MRHPSHCLVLSQIELLLAFNNRVLDISGLILLAQWSAVCFIFVPFAMGVCLLLKQTFQVSVVHLPDFYLFVILQKLLEVVCKLLPKVVLFGVFFQSLLLLLVFSFTFFQLPLTQPGIQARVGVLFIYAVYPVWSTPMPIFTLFPLARAIMKRERYAASYRLTAAYTSKAVALFPWRFLNTMMLGMGSYYIIGLNPGASNFFIFQAIQLDLIFVAQAIGLLVAALCSTADVRDTF